MAGLSVRGSSVVWNAWERWPSFALSCNTTYRVIVAHVGTVGLPTLYVAYTSKNSTVQVFSLEQRPTPKTKQGSDFGTAEQDHDK